MSDETLEAKLAEAVGTWFVEGDPFELVRSPEGGQLATGPTGAPINPGWVMLRGLRTPTPEPGPTPNNG